MTTLEHLPGTPQHQALLAALLAHYRSDPRIRAIVLFGSLARGNWDDHSDLDLDIIVDDDAGINPAAELLGLADSLASTGDRLAVLVPDGAEAGDLVLESLMQLSVRYHPLETTSPAIIDDMQVLAGDLDAATIRAAGMARASSSSLSLQQLLDSFVRYAAVANTYIQRQQLWGAVEVLHRMRAQIMALFAQAHGHPRAFQAFQAEADLALQAQLGATLPTYDPGALRASLQGLLDLVENSLSDLTGGQVELAKEHRAVFCRVRQQLEEGKEE